jgi:hypothetical protein
MNSAIICAIIFVHRWCTKVELNVKNLKKDTHGTTKNIEKRLEAIEKVLAASRTDAELARAQLFALPHPNVTSILLFISTMTSCCSVVDDRGYPGDWMACLGSIQDGFQMNRD